MTEAEKRELKAYRERDAALAEVRRLQEGLRQYGKHGPNCYWDDDRCSCGLSALLSEQKEAPVE